MKCDYFRISSDDYGPTPRERWHLRVNAAAPDAGGDRDKWWDVYAYSRCEMATAPPPYPFFVSSAGPQAEVNIGSFNTCIVSRRVGCLISDIAGSEIQRIPVTVRDASGDWEILNVLSLVDCLDHKRSLIKPYYPDDFLDRERAGKPCGIIRLRIDPDRAASHQIFRIKDWEVPIIVSKQIRDALEAAGAVGVLFQPVTDQAD